MRIEVGKFGVAGAKACLVRNDAYKHVVIVSKSGKKSSSYGFESVRSEGDEFERIELANGDVLYRVVA
jgi:hypothetical protein